MFDLYCKTDLQWIDWVPTALESQIKKEKYVIDNYPELKLIGKSSSGYLIEDVKTKEIITIHIQDNKIIPSNPDPKYLIFCLLHPEFII